MKKSRSSKGAQKDHSTTIVHKITLTQGLAQKTLKVSLLQRTLKALKYTHLLNEYFDT